MDKTRLSKLLTLNSMNIGYQWIFLCNVGKIKSKLKTTDCWVWIQLCHILGFPGGSDGIESAYSAGHLGLIPRSGRFLGEGNGYPLQYSCLKNSMGRGTCQAELMGLQRVARDWETNTHCYLLAMWHWPSYLISLHLSVLNWIIKIVPTSLGFCVSVCVMHVCNKS